MKTLPFFLLIFLANFSLFAQKNSLQILEKQGDSLFLAGQNDQASRVYFRAFLKDILNQRLQNKFGLRNMEQYFSREEYRPIFVKDSTEKANWAFFERKVVEADSIWKTSAIEKALEIYQDLQNRKIGDSIFLRKKVQSLERIVENIKDLKSDSLVRLQVKIIDIMSQESLDTRLIVRDQEGNFYRAYKIGAGHYEVFLPLGKYILIADNYQTSDYQYDEGHEGLNINHLQHNDLLVSIELNCCPCLLFSNFMFQKQQIILNHQPNQENYEKVARYLKDNPLIKMKIEGHATPDEKNAKHLSFRRTAAVAEQLVKLGITPHRLIIEYFGSDSPMVPNDSEANRALNRRVEFKPILPIRN